MREEHKEKRKREMMGVQMGMVIAMGIVKKV